MASLRKKEAKKNLEEKEEKKELRQKEEKKNLKTPFKKLNKKLITFLSIAIILVVFAIFAVLLYIYLQTPEHKLNLGANIENVTVSNDGKNVYVKIAGGSDKNITKIKFIFKDKEGKEYAYETTEGTQEISVPFKRSFWQWLFGKPKYEGKYDYEINASDLELNNFNNIEEVSVLFEYKTETNQTIITPPLDLTKPTTQNKTTTPSSSKTTPSTEPTSCTPTRDCQYYYERNECGNDLNDGCSNILNCTYCPNGKICSNGNCVLNCINDVGCSSIGVFCDGNIPYNCSLGADGCYDKINLTACGINETCISGSCIENKECNSNENCTYLNNICSYGICNLSNKCEIAYNVSRTLCSIGICDENGNCVECIDDSDCGSGKVCQEGSCVEEGVCGNNIKETGEACDGTDLGEETCQSQGYNEGTIKGCCSGCGKFDLSKCANTSSSCTDNDGEDYDTYSNITVCSGGESGSDCSGVGGGAGGCGRSFDSCNNTILSEKICYSNGSSGVIKYNCSQEGKACFVGRCINASYICTDYDGVDYYNSSYVKYTTSSSGVNYTKNDCCNGNILHEGICSTNGELNTIKYSCSSEGKVCQNGKCVNYFSGCGNNFLETWEVCDNLELNGKTCQDFGYETGTLRCCNTCLGFNLGWCYNNTIQCIDYDGGLNPYNKSYAESDIVRIYGPNNCTAYSGCATGGGGSGHSDIGDYCKDWINGGDILIENICNASNYSVYVEYNCSLEGKVCYSGACVECEEGWKCIDDYTAAYYYENCTTQAEYMECEFGWLCQDGVCVKLAECTSNENCSYLNDVCAIGICNATGSCEINYNLSTNVCREVVRECNVAEFCSGNSASCPADQNEADGTICSIGICQDGQCVAGKLGTQNIFARIINFFKKLFGFA